MHILVYYIDQYTIVNYSKLSISPLVRSSEYSLRISSVFGPNIPSTLIRGLPSLFREVFAFFCSEAIYCVFCSSVLTVSVFFVYSSLRFHVNERLYCIAFLSFASDNTRSKAPRSSFATSHTRVFRNGSFTMPSALRSRALSSSIANKCTKRSSLVAHSSVRA